MHGSAQISRPRTGSCPKTIGDVMTRHPASVRPAQSLATAHGLMRSLGVRHLPVVDGGRVVGMVSQGDLRLLESIDRVDVATVQVEEAMIPRPYVVDADTPLAEVLGAMLDRRIGAVVITERGRLLGIFTGVDAISTLRRLVAVEDAGTAMSS
jgi:acetoin utilization protein AcuB